MALSIDKEIYKASRIDHLSGLSRACIVFVLGVLVSSYFFPFEFTFLPEGLNTKIMLAALGIPLLAVHLLRLQKIEMPRSFLFATLIALVFSAIGYVSVDVNRSQDLSYANYIVSFSTWVLGAYALCMILRAVHGYLNFELLFNYLIAVCVVQCFMALAIDYNVSVKAWVDAYISQAPVADVEFLNRVDRLYGIGAAVDVAGTRFSIVLLGLAAVLNTIRRQENKLRQITLYWIAFVIIAVVGNMISRTTLVGVALALGYLGLTSNFFRETLTSFKLTYILVITSVTVGLIMIAVYYYHTDTVVHQQLRFAFEGFFNWVEKGKWYTSSTDRLNSVMWIWPDPQDTKTWLIGKATFDNWHAVGTDIGYCRFVFYNGLIGLVTFSLFFVYNAWACNKLLPGYTLFFVFLLALTFIIWLKVATDLFLIYALFYNIAFSPKEERMKREPIQKLATV